MTLRLAIFVMLLALGCDNSARNEQTATVEKKADDTDEKALAARKEKRLAAERETAAAQEAVRAEIATIAVVPANKSARGLAEACEAVADAQDRFVARLQPTEVQTKWTADRENRRPMAIIECTSADSTDVAACQIAALDNAPPVLAENLKDILDYCVEKFAKPKPAGTPPAGGGDIPKRPR